MTRRNRNIGVFSLSAIDLFASALGAFIILSMLLFPHYLKTKKLEIEASRTEASIEELRNQIEDAALRADAAEADTKEAYAAIKRQQELLEEREELSALAQNGSDWEKTLVSKIEDSSKFALLGHRTKARSFLIVVDTSLVLTKPNDNTSLMLATVERIISSLGHNRKFSLMTYNVTGTRESPEFNITHWPADKKLQFASTDNLEKSKQFLSRAAANSNGLAATEFALKSAMDSPAEAILLITYAAPLWPLDRPAEVTVQNVSGFNKNRKEIHTIAMGPAFERRDFFKKASNAAGDPRTRFIKFMQSLARENRGDFSAVVN